MTPKDNLFHPWKLQYAPLVLKETLKRAKENLVPKNCNEVEHEDARLRELEQDVLTQAQQIANLQRQVLELAKIFAEADEARQAADLNLSMAETMEEERDELRARLDTTSSLLDMAEGALRMVLMFHGGGEWNEEARQRWHTLSVGADCTTKGMCSRIREILLEVEHERRRWS